MNMTLCEIVNMNNIFLADTFNNKAKINVDIFFNKFNMLKMYSGTLKNISNKIDDNIKKIHAKTINDMVELDKKKDIVIDDIYGINTQNKFNKLNILNIHPLQQIQDSSIVINNNILKNNGIPTNQIYYVKDINKFAMSINNFIIVGNIGNKNTS